MLMLCRTGESVLTNISLQKKFRYFISSISPYLTLLVWFTDSKNYTFFPMGKRKVFNPKSLMLHTNNNFHTECCLPLPKAAAAVLFLSVSQTL